MNINHNFLFSLVCSVMLALFSSCSPENTQDYPSSDYVIPIEPEMARQTFLDEFVQDTDTVLFNMKDEFLRNVSTIKYRDSTIYILDSGLGGADMAINAFGLDGERKFKIQEIGRGPGEYEFIYSYWITDNFLYLASRRNLLVYNNRTGEFVKSVAYTADLQSMDWVAVSGDSSIIDYDGRTRSNVEKKYLKLIDIESGEILNRKASFSSHALKGAHSNSYFYQVSDYIFFIPSYEKTILKLNVSDDSIRIEPKYSFDVKEEYWVPNNLLENSYSDRDTFFAEISDYINTIIPYETSDVIFAEYYFQGNRYGVIHFKENQVSFQTVPYTQANEACKIFTVVDNKFAFLCDDYDNQTLILKTLGMPQ